MDPLQQTQFNPQVPEEKSAVARFLIKNSGGLIKTRQQASNFVLVILILVIAISAYVLISQQSAAEKQREIYQHHSA